MYKTHKYNYAIRNLVKDSKKYFVYESIMVGNTPGEIYVNDIDEPTSTVIFDGGNFVLYFEGECQKSALDYVKNCVLTEALEEAYDDHILAVFPSDEWYHAFEEAFKDYTMFKGNKTLLQHDLIDIKEQSVPEDIEVKRIDSSVLNGVLEHVDCLIEEVSSMWGSKEKFEAGGFGTCAVKDQTLVAWCTAEFVSEKQCGIGIETIEAYQQKNIGTVITKAFLDLCKEKEMTPHWDSWTENVPSVKTALKNDFKVIDEMAVIVLKFV